MNIKDKNIDGGAAFDWGNASEDYGKFCDTQHFTKSLKTT